MTFRQRFRRTLRELNHRRLWATDGNRKLNFSLFGAFSRHRVCNVKPQSSTRAFPVRAKEQNHTNKENIRLPVAVSRELKQRRRQRQRKRHLKIYLYFICATSRFITTRSTFTESANYPGTKLVGVMFNLRKRVKNLPPCVHLLRKTLNLVISRCCFVEDGKEMYQNLKRTAGRLFLLIKASDTRFYTPIAVNLIASQNSCDKIPQLDGLTLLAIRSNDRRKSRERAHLANLIGDLIAAIGENCNRSTWQFSPIVPSVLPA